eukprot:gene9700-13057_t
MIRTRSSILRAHSRGSFERLVFESEHSLGGGSPDRSLVFRFAQLVVVLLRSITPLSYLYITYLILFQVTAEKMGLGLIVYYCLLLWSLAEAVFFLYYYNLFTKLSKRNPRLNHFASDTESRLKLVSNCFYALKASCKDGSGSEKYLRKVIEGWFLDLPIIQIYKGNFASWTSWAFFGKDIRELSSDEKKENDEIIDFVEKEAQWKFPEGFSSEIPAARLDLDPIFATQRPFLFYAVIWLVNSITHIVLWLWGFKRLPQFDTTTHSQAVYMRKKSVVASNQNSSVPIIFVHGIGIGFAHYLGLLFSLPTEVDVFLIEWPHVAMQMATTSPSAEESVDLVIRLLNHFNHSQVSIVAHSLGTVLLSWLLHDKRVVERVVSSVLLDPVSFLLCDPKVATSFVYKDPTNTLDFLMHFFLSRELFIANALSRHFAWSKNIMFVEDFKNCSRNRVDNQNDRTTKIDKNKDGDYDYYVASASQSNDDSNYQNQTSLSDGGLSKNSTNATNVRHTIILSSHDAIVPVGPVSRYLEHKLRKGKNDFEVLMFHGTHGEMMLHPSWIRLIANK